MVRSICNFCHGYRDLIFLKELPTSGFHICTQCIPIVSIANVEERLHNFSRFTYLQTIKEITDDNTISKSNRLVCSKKQTNKKHNGRSQI